MSDVFGQFRSNLMANCFIEYLHLIPAITKSKLDVEDFYEKMTDILLKFFIKIENVPQKFVCQVLNKWQNILAHMSNEEKFWAFASIELDKMWVFKKFLCFGPKTLILLCPKSKISSQL